MEVIGVLLRLIPYSIGMRLPSSAPHSAHSGFALIEAVVALILIGVGLLALEGAAVFTLRRIRDSQREALAAQLVQTRTARLFATGCASANGIDSIDVVVAAWSATATGGMLRVDQTVRYPTAFGAHVESYHTARVCP